jgi:hypothetical protein
VRRRGISGHTLSAALRDLEDGGRQLVAVVPHLIAVRIEEIRLDNPSTFCRR